MWGLHAAIVLDKLEPRSLAIVEHSCRRCTQIMKAVCRNPRAPDFENLASLMRHVGSGSSGLYMPEFEKDLAETQRNEGLMLKNARLHREEVETEKTKNQQGGGGGKRDKKKNKGDGKGDDE